MSWMAWTLPTALFFGAIGLSLLVLTIWELRAPTTQRRGFLPIATTRGDRFFISLLCAAFIHLAWLGLVGTPLYPATLIAVAAGVGLMRWG